jgi:hypothetical protein
VSLGEPYACCEIFLGHSQHLPDNPDSGAPFRASVNLRFGLDLHAVFLSQKLLNINIFGRSGILTMPINGYIFAM